MQVILFLSLHLVQKEWDSPTAKISATLSHLERLPANKQTNKQKVEKTLPYIKKKKETHTETKEGMALVSCV